MFITCNTWRQATYAPDQNFSASATSNSGATTSSSAVAVAGTTFSDNFITNASTSFYVGAQSIADLPFGTILTSGTTSIAVSQTTNSGVSGPQTTLTFHNPAGGATTTHVTTVAVTTIVTGTSQISSVGGTMQDFHGITTFTNITTQRTIANTTTANNTYTLLSGTSTWTATFSSSSTSQIISSATTSFSTTTGGGIFVSSISTAITSTTSTSHGFTSTTTQTAAREIWTTNPAHAAVTTTAQVTTTSTIATSASLSGATTVSTTTATPSWWGFSSERGTLLLATGNSLSNDLPAWLEKSNFTGSIPALWNYTFTTQTTLWPAQPSTTRAGVAIPATAVPHTTFLSLVTATTFTLFGTSTISFTTTSSTAAAAFTDTADPFYTTAGFPISTIALTVTSYTTTSSTITGFVTHGLNTTVSTSIQSFTADHLTLIVGSTTFPSTGGTYTTTVSVTTLTSGYTTASMATGNGIMAVSSTTILTAPQISLTTTTMSLSFWYNTNNPTVLSSSSSSSQSSTTSVNGVFSVTNSGSTLAGFTSNYTYNLFSAPYVMFSPEYSLTSLAAGTLAVYAAPAVTWWAGTPTMQGFVAMSVPGSTYQDIQGPAGAIAAFMPAATGPVLNFLSAGGANTSTAWGVWQLVAVPNTATVTSTTTTTGSPSTTGTTYTVISNFSFGYAASNSAGTTANTIYFANPPVESDATVIYAITATATSTVSTAGIPTSVSTTTTSSGSTSVSTGFSLAAAITSTFAESFGYLSTSTGIKTISSIGGITYTTGTAPTATKSYLFITTLAVTATDYFTTSWNPANTSSVPTQLLAPGVGGYAKITTDGETIYINGAAVSYFAGSTFTWSTAAANFMKIVVGGTLTTSSSTTSTAGALAATFTVYSLPGQGSLLTSPLSWISTHQDKWTPADLTQTAFWNTPAPYSTPNNVINR